MGVYPMFISADRGFTVQESVGMSVLPLTLYMCPDTMSGQH